MKTISEEEFKRLYGEVGLASFAEKPKDDGPIKGPIKRAFQGGLDQIGRGVEQSKAAKNPIQKTEAGLNMIAGGVNAAFSPLAPITEPTIGAGINYAADKISENKGVQDFAMSKAGEATGRVAEDVANVATIGGAAFGAKGAGVVGKGAVKATAKGAQQVGQKMGKAVDDTANYLPGAVRDIVPTTDAVVHHQIAKALDLTPGDISNISKSTGNEVPRWLADNNLIGTNKETTRQLIQDFQRTNYETVRSEIAKVSKFYKQYQVPRYVDALKQINKKIENAPGLEKQWAEVQNLLKKEEFTLDDVQRAKELIDDHFKLYKVTGDVGEGVAKEGIANMRKDLKTFIEKEVKKETGADIKQMNNNVATARSLDDAIETRSPKGLTSSNFKAGDMATLGYGSFAGGPVFGLAALFIKKVAETPTVRLRIARYLDTLSDAKKKRIEAELRDGDIPKEFDRFIKKRPSSAP